MQWRETVKVVMNNYFNRSALSTASQTESSVCISHIVCSLHAFWRLVVMVMLYQSKYTSLRSASSYICMTISAWFEKSNKRAHMLVKWDFIYFRFFTFMFDEKRRSSSAKHKKRSKNIVKMRELKKNHAHTLNIENKYLICCNKFIFCFFLAILLAVNISIVEWVEIYLICSVYLHFLSCNNRIVLLHHQWQLPQAHIFSNLSDLI